MHTKRFLFNFFLFFILIGAFVSCLNSSKSVRQTISLAGEWQLQLDEKNVGIQEGWFSRELTDTVLLPGSLDENRKGYLNKDTTDYHLNRLYAYYGTAWYRKEIEIPEDWGEKHVALILERTKVTHVWLDSQDLGTCNDLYSPQVYDLTGKLTPGKHSLTILVNNDEQLVPVAGSHAYSEDTQTNWNGILGRFCLEATNPIAIESVRVTPDIEKKLAAVKVKIRNPEAENVNLTLRLKADAWNSDVAHSVASQTYDFSLSSGDTTLQVVYNIGSEMQRWSEFDPALYKLKISLENAGQRVDDAVVDFGMRDFRTRGSQFTINGKTTFLRGKHEACVFPLTGYPPMDVDGWLRVLKIARSYGINYYRFHSWTPPEAAFKAADICGMYFQSELPIWWSFKAEDSSQVAFMMKEGYKIFDTYGNYASFVMFALGNEITQDPKILKQMISDFREYDSRPLFAQGSNNRLWDPSFGDGDDFWVSFRTGQEKSDCSTDIRTSMSYLDAVEGGILNTLYPATNRNFAAAIKGAPGPVVGFEVGQYQVYPNYEAELPKYTGVLKPWNLELFRKRLAEKGMKDQEQDFFKASGALSVLCYREDIESAIRTPGFGGFNLLDLQDYPGQGTALVGMLDAFMDNKGLITPEEFRQFCDEVILLLSMKKYCWVNQETFKAEIQLANYSAASLKNDIVQWQMLNSAGEVVESGEVGIEEIHQGQIETVGAIQIALKNIEKAAKYTIALQVKGKAIKTSYPIWVYPMNVSIDIPEKLMVTQKLDAAIIQKLDEGAKIVFFADTSSFKEKSVGGQFIAEFWNYRMFKNLAKQFGRRVSHGTMGLLMKPSHPIFNDFPTEFHSNWQWWLITKNSRPLILDDTAADYRPVIQVVDNINRNHKLGLVFEFKVGSGKLLVCMADLPSILNKPEARQLYSSILNYAGSENFNPPNEISGDNLLKLFY